MGHNILYVFLTLICQYIINTDNYYFFKKIIINRTFLLKMNIKKSFLKVTSFKKTGVINIIEKIINFNEVKNERVF